MKFKSLTFSLTIFLLVSYQLLTTSLVFAHTLKSDGSIGAVIHIDPEDDPIIGEPASFSLSLRIRRENLHQTNVVV